MSKSSGIGVKGGNGLGVVMFDYDNDGWQDIFIANDHMPNFLFHNNRDGTFCEVGYLAGVAVSADGQFEAGMGCDAADIVGNGRMDLIVTHLDMQLAHLYQNLGDQTFDDATFRSKLSYATYHRSGLGTRFMDYDKRVLGILHISAPLIRLCQVRVDRWLGGIDLLSLPELNDRIRESTGQQVK